MPNRIIQKSYVKRLTENGDYQYPGFQSEVGEVSFSSTFATAYFDNLTFKKIKGGGAKGGNYRCVENNDEYRISKY